MNDGGSFAHSQCFEFVANVSFSKLKHVTTIDATRVQSDCTSELVQSFQISPKSVSPQDARSKNKEL